jgi:hypothetical protein
MIHSGNRRYPDSARTTTPNAYSFHSAAVDVHSLGVESIHTFFFLQSLLKMLHVSKEKGTVRGQWIKCTSYAQFLNLAEMCNVLEGSREVPFRRVFILEDFS